MFWDIILRVKMHEQRFYTEIYDFLQILFFCAFCVRAFVSQCLHSILQRVFCVMVLSAVVL